MIHITRGACGPFCVISNVCFQGMALKNPAPCAYRSRTEVAGETTIDSAIKRNAKERV